MTRKVTQAYEALYAEILTPLALALRSHLADILSDVERIDAISTRAKTPKSFEGKAAKTGENGKIKYLNPLYEIQDQVGARVVVFYLSDIDVVRTKLKDYLVPIESIEKSPERDSEFGYVGEHFLFSMPDELKPEDREDDCPHFFELQIKTLFQHAWSEASHDIAYKAPRQLTRLENRQMAFSAAQSWGADQIFEELYRAIADNDG